MLLIGSKRQVFGAMISELGNFLLAMALGFAGVQALASFCGKWGNPNSLTLGRVSAFLQGGFLSAAFLTLIIAFLLCDFSLLIVTLHDHSQLPWYYRFAATWGNHEGSLLLFVLILSGVSVAFGAFLHDPLLRGRALTIQGLLTVLFLVFLIMTSNPFTALPFTLSEGQSLNPLLQDRGLVIHPPLLYLGYVGFSAPFSLAIAALWGREDVTIWGAVVRPWALFAWGALTAGITLGSWWAYYELGWGGWWFWDPVENASFMPVRLQNAVCRLPWWIKQIPPPQQFPMVDRLLSREVLIMFCQNWGYGPKKQPRLPIFIPPMVSFHSGLSIMKMMLKGDP